MINLDENPANAASTTPSRDPQLWEEAKKRASFKNHLYSYLAVNGLLWGIWLLATPHEFDPVPWPAWTSFFWGFGLVMDGISTYTRTNSAEKEYERLRRQRGGDKNM